MKHTKNILKSLLITVMALSLLAVSCKKDEGGSKPTDPQTVDVDATTITGIVSAMFSGTVDDNGASLFASKTITPASGKAAIDTAVGKKIATDIKTKLKTSIETVASAYASVVTLTSDVDNLTKDLTLTMKPANANVNFTSDVTDGKTYSYDAAKGEASLVITITEK